MIDEELREQESQALVQKMKEMEKEDVEAAQHRREEARKVMEQVARANQQALEVRQREADALRQEDLRLADYLKEKEARDLALEEQKEQDKRERDREFATLLARQEQAMDQVAERHSLAAKRQQEAVERERRRKEAEKAKRQEEVRCFPGGNRPFATSLPHVCTLPPFSPSPSPSPSHFLTQALAALHKTREEQIRAKERVLALQAMQEKEEFERILDAQKELIRAEEEEAKAKEHVRRLHAREIQEQIGQREQERQDERRAFFREGLQLDEEAAERRRRLDAIKQRKLEDLQQAGIDPKYVTPVKRLVGSASRTQTISTS
jgi:hypothetical protein